ncbi:prolyl oligopeptidase family serine peptidase, partial [Dehalococcoidales bacterium]|nr:prolyl oligopeptidase family serine peptidase [Dehalococcoidales bacterium]
IIFNRGGNRNFGLLIPQQLVSYALRGYVVVGSQYRGSCGGEGQEEFGGADINDVLNLIPLLKNMPNVDADRIGMIGVSRGGMMTYIALKEQTLRGTDDIKVAVVINGIADLFMAAEERPGLVDWVLAPLIGGTPNQVPEEYEARSATYWADKINVPLLIQHGEVDKKVSVDQARKLAKELDKYGKVYKLIVYPGYGHALGDPRAFSDRFAWLDHYLK